jgi:hypothetical protein
MISRISYFKDTPVAHNLQETLSLPGLSPEMEMIVQSIGVKEDRENAIEKILKKGIDWKKLKKIVLYHHVLPLLYNQLKEMNDSLVPQKEMADIKSLYKNNAQNNLRQAQLLLRLLMLLSENGIEVIPFKGLALTVQAYGDLSLRTFSDLDILIHTEDFCKIYNVLTAAGFCCCFPLTKQMKKYWMLFRRNVEFIDKTRVLDFHHQMTQGSRRISLKEKTWQNRCTVELLSQKIPVLSPEHSLLSLCIHGTKDHWRTLRIMADIAHLISRHPTLNWKALVSDAKEIGCLRMLCVGLHLSQQVCGLELPGEVLGLIRKERKTVKLASKYLYQLPIIERSGKTGKLYETFALINSMDSFGPRIHYLGHFAFTPTPLDWKFIKLPEFLYPLYYLVRPLRLLFKLVSRPFQSLFFNNQQSQQKPTIEY